MITTIYLDEEHLKGMLVNAGDRRVRICKHGLSLFDSCKWYITYSNYYLHFQMGRGKIIPFHRVLLELYRSDEIVKFRNGNTLDSRLCNLVTRSIRYVDIYGHYIPNKIMALS